MFDINPWELGILVVLFLIVFGPDRIPDAMAQLGRAYRQMQGFADQATGDLRREIAAAARETDPVRTELAAARRATLAAASIEHGTEPADAAAGPGAAEPGAARQPPGDDSR